MFQLRQNLVKNFGGISNPQLYKVAHSGTKINIEEYQNEVIRCFKYLYHHFGSSNDLVKTKTLRWFQETRQSFGRTALMLSGGASMGKYHHGIIKALSEEDLIPRIICGSSAGSIFVACLSTLKIKEIDICNTHEFVHTRQLIGWNEDSIFKTIQKFLQGKPVASMEMYKNFVRGFTKDLTFLDVF